MRLARTTNYDVYVYMWSFNHQEGKRRQILKDTAD